MPRIDFLAALQSVGVKDLEEKGQNTLVFSYVIESGRFAGQTVRLGIVVDDSWPLTPPSGIHVSPQLLPLQPGGEHPTGAIHSSVGRGDFAADFQYWSRPYPDWQKSDRSVRTYMAHVRRLFDDQ
ncbi:MAG: hypothetical protein V4671_06705 [Armatimonadota bacterium]